MKTCDVITHSEKETIELGRRVAATLAIGSVVALHGTLGTGKTTITKGIVAGLFPHRKIKVKSPSFALVNQYNGTFPIFHIDCYRLEGESEFENIGIDEFIFAKGVTIVEWPERIASFLPETVLHVYITGINETERKFSFESKEVKSLRALRSLIDV
jgi:tRNA threonylcarbamoyladenosine biosynthesis protein TsaE